MLLTTLKDGKATTDDRLTMDDYLHPPCHHGHGHKVTERVSNGEASSRDGRVLLEESRSCGTRNDEETLHITVGVEPKKKVALIMMGVKDTLVICGSFSGDVSRKLRSVQHYSSCSRREMSP